MDKKILLLVFFGILIISFSLMISATVSIRDSSLVNQSNHTTSISNITCQTDLTGVTNMTFWYNASAHTGVSAVATERLTYVANTSVAQTLNFSVLSVDVSNLAASDTYTFWCEATNATGTTSQNSSYYNITNITIDNTAPAIIIHTTNTNATIYKNTETATLNISVIDTIWLTDGAYCFFNINGTNETVSLTRDGSSITKGWCNTTHLNLTSMVDGNNITRVWINDSLGNMNHNYTRYVLVDTTNPPSPTALCSPASVVEGSTITCTCSGGDPGSGVNSTTADSTPSTLSKGTFTYTCSVTDNAGNSASTEATYTITDSAGTSRGTSTTTATVWTHGTTITSSDLEAGHTQSLGTKHRIKFQFNAENHHVGVVSVTEQEATIEIASDPIQVILGIGEDAKVDIIDDGFYDIYVILNAITNNKADVTVQKIHEEIPAGEEGPVTTTGEEITGEGEEAEGEEERNLTWLWILIGVVVLAVIIGGGIAAKKKQ